MVIFKKFSPGAINRQEICYDKAMSDYKFFPDELHKRAKETLVPDEIYKELQYILSCFKVLERHAKV